jgi:hypothetical protein
LFNKDPNLSLELFAVDVSPFLSEFLWTQQYSALPENFAFFLYHTLTERGSRRFFHSCTDAIEGR